MNQHSYQLLLLVLATFFVSTSGALGKHIDMPTPVIIWWRASIALVILFAFCKLKSISLKINSRQDFFRFLLSAFFMGGHWLTYFYALKLSNVAIGMLSLFVYPIITAFLEPLFFKIKFDPIYILLGIMVLLGIYILAPEFNLESKQLKGLLFGLASALCYALRNIIAKQLVGNRYHGTTIMLYQIGVVTILLAPVLFFMDTSGITTQFPYVLTLAIVTTAIGHTMLVNSLKHFTVSTASIISSVQPILGIVIAFLFLSEVPSWNTFWGGLIILSTVVIESVRSRKS